MRAFRAGTRARPLMSARPRFRAVAALVVLATAIGVSACTTDVPKPSSSPSSSAGGHTSHPTDPADSLAGMTLEQVVGQLFMVGTSATVAQDVTLAAISDRHVGSVFLTGRSYAGVAGTQRVVNDLVARVTAQSTHGIPLLVATDQEGGQVQVLHGKGFSAMPSGLQQGALSPAVLKTQATTWGAQLKSAGVNMNLAPVVDLIGSPTQAAFNPPIGGYDRELGFGAPDVIARADSIRSGMKTSGVLTVLKHFPGLGYVTKNTDTSAGVVDTTIGNNGANISLYKTEIARGANAIMVSSATYFKLDPKNPAVFSDAVVRGLLRTTLGYDGLVMTDDMSGAAQVAQWSPAQRAIKSISAGVDLVLVSKYPDVAPAMIDAVVAKAKSDPAFLDLVDRAARRVLALKKTL